MSRQHRPLRSLALSILISIGASTTAPAALALNTIALEPSTPSVTIGDFVDILVSMDFDDMTFGGGVALTYDQSVLSFDSFVFDAAFSANFGRGEPAAGSLLNPLEVQFGWFFTSSPIGPTPIGSFRFRANRASPNVEFSSSEVAASTFAGGAGTLPVSFGATTLAVVPEPGTAILLMTGLVLLAGRGRD